MQPNAAILSQFNAALDMLEQTVDACPEAVWLDATAPNRFWQVAYHTLFYVHLYAQPTLADFEPWEHHRLHYELLGPPPWEPELVLTPDEPYAKADIYAYLTFCRTELAHRTQTIDWNAPSGFEWLPCNKLELQIYSIRHVQQHTGELSGRLLEAGIEIDWVGMQPA